MARIFPFRPYRYSPAAGDPNQLVTQPYDKISPAMRERYLALSPHNLVRIILGEKHETDSERDNPYTRAAAHFEDWAAKGILAKDAEPAFYVYFQEFTPPDSTERMTRKGFIGLGAVEDYAAGVVHRHEQTLSGPKKDRMQVLEHTRAHFGQIFMLYPDREGVIDRMLDEAAAAKPDVEVTDELGAVHRLWRLADPAKIAAIQQAMSGKKLLIADGHHRYETALNFHKAHPELEDASNVMMTFVNMYSPGLKVLATHRVVSNLEHFDLNEFIKRIPPEFTVVRVPDVPALKERLNDSHAVAIGVVAQGSSKFLVLDRDRKPEDLDVRILHDILLRDTLGINEEAVRDEKHIRYVRGIEAAIDAVRNGGAQIAFLLQPASVEQTAAISFAGGVMPQKSTDFYPKLLSGLTIYKLEK